MYFACIYFSLAESSIQMDNFARVVDETGILNYEDPDSRQPYIMSTTLTKKTALLNEQLECICNELDSIKSLLEYCVLNKIKVGIDIACTNLFTNNDYVYRELVFSHRLISIISHCNIVFSITVYRS